MKDFETALMKALQKVLLSYLLFPSALPVELIGARRANINYKKYDTGKMFD